MPAAVTTITLVSSKNPSLTGETVTFTATVTGGSGYTGTITFYCDNVNVGSAVGGTSTLPLLSPSQLPLGTHLVYATYTGDINNANSTSTPTISQVVATVINTTSLALVSSLNPTANGGSVTFTATLSGGSAYTGSIIFKDGASTLGTGVISGTTASYTILTLPVGSHSITAVYVGSGNNLPSTSPVVNQSVLYTTSTTIASSQSTTTYGQPVTLTATIDTIGTPTGTVTFYDNTTINVGSAAVSAKVAILVITSLPIATHILTATYNGDSTNRTSNSSTITQVVNISPATNLFVDSFDHYPTANIYLKWGGTPANFTILNNILSNSALTINNYGFESPALAAGAYALSPANAGWTFSGVSAGIARNNSAYNNDNPNAPEGSQVGLIQYTGAISQSISGWVVGPYVITFLAALRNFGPRSQDFNIQVDNVVVGTFRPSSINYSNYFTSFYNTTAGAHTVKFQGLNTAGGDNTAFIDAVTISQYSSVTRSGAIGTGCLNLATSSAFLSWPFGTTSTNVIVGFAIKFGAIIDQTFLIFNTNSGVQAGGLALTGGKLRAYTGSTNIVGPTILAPNVWYFVEMQMFINNSGSIKVNLNGTSEIIWNGNTTTSMAYVDHINIGSGANLTSATSVSWDDLYIVLNESNTASFFGPVGHRVLYPTGSGASNDWTNYSWVRGGWVPQTSLYFNYAVTGDATPNIANPPNPMMQCGVYGTIDMYTHTQLTTAPIIYAIQFNNTCANWAGTSAIRNLIRIGSTYYGGPTIYLQDGYHNFKYIVSLNPATTATWTMTDLNSAQIGVQAI